jgi:outer membrane protein assembly factor BamB
MSALAGSRKIYEVKITADPLIASGEAGESFIYVGNKNFNLVDLANGRMVMDKTFREAGSSVAKASDACFSDDKLIICDAKTVSCIDFTTGKKLWEDNTFSDLTANNSGALVLCDDYVLVSDKKQKDNFTLTCLNINSGKIMWTVENQKTKIKPENVASITGYGFGAYIITGKVNQLNVVNLETGKISYTSEIQGEPVYIFYEISKGDIFIHNRVSEAESYVTALNLKEGTFLWKNRLANKSPNKPQIMNTNEIRYYVSMKRFDDKLLVKTEGVEVIDINTGRSLYNIPIVPYYKWGVGHYINGIFDPIVTPTGILLADRTAGDLFVKMYDKNTGKLLWATDKIKGTDTAPHAIVTGNSVAIQFGGLNYFEVVNNGAIGKLLDPFVITSFDLQTGKTMWTLNSRQSFYQIDVTNENIMIVGKSNFQTVDAKTGKIIKTDDNPFGEDYFMTKYTLNSTHKVQKDVLFNFSDRTVYRSEVNKLIKYSF